MNNWVIHMFKPRLIMTNDNIFYVKLKVSDVAIPNPFVNNLLKNSTVTRIIDDISHLKSTYKSTLTT